MNYPTGESVLPSVKVLYDMITGNSPKNIQQALKHGWILQGYLQGMIAGEPAEVITQSIEPASIKIESGMQDEEAIVALGRLKDRLELEASGELVVPASISGFIVEFGLKLLLPTVQRWLLEWLNDGGLDNFVDALVPKIKNLVTGESN